MMRWGYGMMGGWFGMFITLILIIAVVFVVFRVSGNNHVNYAKNNFNSLDILDERFAKGEITKEEYEQKKAMIMRR